MKLNIALILSIVFAVGLVALVFTIYSITSERYKLNSELENKTAQVAAELFPIDSVGHELTNRNIDAFTDSVQRNYNILGIAIYTSPDVIIYNNSVSDLIRPSLDYISQAISADSSIGQFI